MAVENPFVSGQRKVIPAVLIYLKRRGKILMLHKEGRRWNGLGGKLEVDESPPEAARREVLEESGLDLPVSRYSPLGFLQFPNFKAEKNQDWWVVVFSVELTEEDPEVTWTECEEGKLQWIPAEEVMGLELWPGDPLFIPMVLENRPFVGTLWYHQGQVTRHWIQGIQELPGTGAVVKNLSDL